MHIVSLLIIITFIGKLNIEQKRVSSFIEVYSITHLQIIIIIIVIVYIITRIHGRFK